METSRKGDIAEAAVLHEFLRHDMNVSIPYGEFPYDLVVEIDGTLYRVQVKRGFERENKRRSIAVSLEGKYDKGDFDILAVYYEGQTYYEWFEDVGTHKFSLSLMDPEDLSPQVRGRAHLAKDYGIERLK